MSVIQVETSTTIYDIIRTAVEAGTFIAIAAATGVAAWQTKKVARQTKLAVVTARATVYQGIMQEMLTIDRFFVENPDLRAHFYKSAACSPKIPRWGRVRATQRLQATAEMLVDFADQVYLQASNIRDEEAYPGESDLWERWADYFHDLYLQSLVLRGFLDEHRAWLKPGLLAMIETGKMPDSASG